MFEKERKELLEITGLYLERMMFDFLSVLTRSPVIDIQKLDRELHIRFGEYEERGLSMDDILQQKFTPAGYALINRMLLPDKTK